MYIPSRQEYDIVKDYIRPIETQYLTPDTNTYDLLNTSFYLLFIYVIHRKDVLSA